MNSTASEASPVRAQDEAHLLKYRELSLDQAESVRKAYLNAFRLEVCNDLGSAEDSAGSPHVKLHELYHAAHLQVVPSTVKGQPFAYQSNLLLHRAYTDPCKS